MLETRQELYELIKQVAQELGITGAQLNVGEQLPDSIVEKEEREPFIHSTAPNWYVGIKFSLNEESKAREFVISTSDFENLDQIKTFIKQELQK